jgi:hypothetical protein
MTAALESKAEECGVLLFVCNEMDVGEGYIGDGIFPRNFSDLEKKL